MNKGYGKLDPKFKKRWVAALRSGEFQQTCRYLHVLEKGFGVSPGYCCLGVAGKLIAPQRFLRHGCLETLNGCANVLSPDLCKAVGLTSAAHRMLGWMNDSGESFDKIADWIEEHL